MYSSSRSYTVRRTHLSPNNLSHAMDVLLPNDVRRLIAWEIHRWGMSRVNRHYLSIVSRRDSAYYGGSVMFNVLTSYGVTQYVHMNFRSLSNRAHMNIFYRVRKLRCLFDSTNTLQLDVAQMYRCPLPVRYRYSSGLTSSSGFKND